MDTLRPIDKLASVCVSSIAATATAVLLQPLDTIKTVMQLSDKSAGESVREMIAKDGAKALLDGTTTAAVRQFTFGTARMAAYNGVSRYLKGRMSPASAKLTAGCIG